MLKKNLANMITSVRIMGTLLFLFLAVPSTAFYAVYAISGISDALDGFVARKMKIQSRFGSALDSFADLFFYTAMMLKVLPVLFRVLPGFVWYVLAVILLLRVTDYVYTARKFGRFAAMHTILNKLTGGMMFLIPFLMETGMPFTVYSCCLLAVGLAAIIQELSRHIREKNDTNREI